MFKKRDNCQTVREVVERNTGVNPDVLLHVNRFPYIKNLKEAVALLREHKNDTIHIVADYDVDGICSACIMIYGLYMAGMRFTYRLPRRFSEGYGLSEKIIDEIDAGVVITVDNGIAAHSAIKKAKEKGLTVIVTDHHQAVTENQQVVLPDADIIVDPSIESESEFHDFCGAGIAYRFVQELLGKEIVELMILAAIATVADVMPLIGPNHQLVKDGIHLLNQGYGIPGILSLLQAKNKSVVTEEDFGFYLGPILNAPGRLMDNGSEKTLSYLLMPSTHDKLDEMAEKLLDINNNRKLIMNTAIESAKSDYNGERPIVLYLPSLGEGIIGLVAGNFCETYQCPVICFTKMKSGLLKGSGRSIPGIHLKKVLDSMKELIVGYGGHAGAAGLTIKEENLDAFTKAFAKACGKIPEIDHTRLYDLEIQEQDIPSVMEELKRYSPYGEGNEKILFHIVCNLKKENFRKVGDGSHISHYSPALKIIGYRMSEQFDKICKEHGFPRQLECVGYLSESWYQNKCSYQMELVDFCYPKK